MKQISENKVFGGWHRQYSHQSKTCNCDMRFAVFLPEQAQTETPVPVLYWLSGLTCTDENFMQKAGAFRAAAKAGIAIVAPDTSPRGEGVADDEGYDLGQGAGFYVNATQTPWSAHYQMYDYVTQELPELIEQSFPVSKLKSISGHSMGGHGALVIGLRETGGYQSASAFSPICHPTQCLWGQKAFNAYLGNNHEAWREYDATLLLNKVDSAKLPPILVDQGDADGFLQEQLMPDALVDAAKRAQADLTLRMQPGYDHSYYFISTFIDEHIAFHANALKG